MERGRRERGRINWARSESPRLIAAERIAAATGQDPTTMGVIKETIEFYHQKYNKETDPDVRPIETSVEV